MKLVDITLLSKEIFDIEVEENFFKANPDKGELVMWPVLGSLMNPNWLSDKERRQEVAELINSTD